MSFSLRPVLPFEKMPLLTTNLGLMAAVDSYLEPSIQGNEDSTDQYRHHRYRMRQAVKDLQAKVIVEGGTNVGRSTRIWAEALEETDGHLWTIDVKPPLGDWHIGYAYNHRITYILQDVLHTTWRDEHPIDILYIDDDHTYPHVLYELRRWAPYVRVGGRIFLDDVQHADWTYSEPNTEWYVLRAMAEFCQESLLPWIVHSHGQGMGEIVMTHPVMERHGYAHDHAHAADDAPRA